MPGKMPGKIRELRVFDSVERVFDSVERDFRGVEGSACG